ncbi:hypothetical protein LCGC14_0702740 [marine sediment metagenome]|uniref:Prepilin-type N-terminal cleavage/methylation domain-containing protein n=1 Tax=marine sediment metagenome TaxID=412755 RepID=A0A0F9TQ26_9ZZZZ
MLQTDFSLIELVVLVLLTFGFAMASWMANVIRSTEAYRRYGMVITQLDDVIWGAIMAAKGDAINMTFWEDHEDQRMQNGEPYIDARMLYVIDVAERWVATQGITIDFGELFTRAEGAYQALKETLEPPSRASLG